MRDEPIEFLDVRVPPGGAGSPRPILTSSSSAPAAIDMRQSVPGAPGTWSNLPRSAKSGTPEGEQFPRNFALVTRNRSKVADFASLLGFEPETLPLELREVQSLDVAQVALQKAETAFALVRRPVLVDDSGLYIDAWNGLPGAFTGWFFETVGGEGLLHMLQHTDNRAATAVTALAVCDATGARVCVGEVKGSVAERADGSMTDGHNAIWIPDGESRTVAAMPQSRRARVSSRAAAVELLHRRVWSVARYAQPSNA